MRKESDVRSLLFRKICLTAFFLNVAVFVLFMLFGAEFLQTAAGLVLGSAAALLKLYLTFLNIAAKLNGGVTEKRRMLTSAANASGVLIVAGALIGAAFMGANALLAAGAGVFGVYLAVLAAGFGRKKEDGDRRGNSPHT